MKKIFLIAAILPVGLFAQNYNVSLIPDSLKENAVAVTRFEETRLVVQSNSRAVLKHKYAITILSEAGDDYADYNNDYSSMRELSDITGTLYDQQGNKLKVIKRKEIGDVSTNDGISLMQDSRIKYHSFNYKQYPYTVEYEDQTELKGIISFQPWMPVGNQKYSIQESQYILDVPADYSFRVKQFNYPGQPVKTEKDKRVQYTWQVKNFKAFKYEPFQPDYREVVPCVYVAPNKFSYGGVEGEMDTWFKFGKYQVELNKGRDALPENIKQQVRQLTANLTDKREKVKVLYEYMQKNTRYVSVQLGIGGLQPFDATYVATKNYGDCKALSNYMVALLKEVGIPAHYTIIYAGEGEKFYMPDFPMRQSNHIIVGVPMEKDTMWLECTSQTKPAGYLGSFTDDRYALMIKEDGGYLVRTPTYTKEQNLQIRNVKATINEQGNLVAEVTSRYTGVQQDDLHEQIHNLSKDKMLNNLKQSLDLPTYDIAQLEYKEQKGYLPYIDETYKLTAENYATVSGKRFFVAPNILTRQRYKLDDEQRKFDIVYDHAFRDIDSVTITIPAGYTLEAMPKDVSITNKFGSFKIQYKYENGTVTMYRLHERSCSRFPPTDYKEFTTFINEMYKADRGRLVLVKG